MSKLIRLHQGKVIPAEVLAKAIKKYVDMTRSPHTVTLESMYPELAELLKAGPVGGVTYAEISNIPLSSFPAEDILHRVNNFSFSISPVKNDPNELRKQLNLLEVDFPTTPFKGNFKL